MTSISYLQGVPKIIEFHCCIQLLQAKMKGGIILVGPPCISCKTFISRPHENNWLRILEIHAIFGVVLSSASNKNDGYRQLNVRQLGSGKCYIDRKRIQCLLNALRHVPIYLQPFPTNSSRKTQRSPF